MTEAFEVLMLVALIGGVDVLWFHLYRARLFERPASRTEQVTHLARHLLFAMLCVSFLVGAPRSLLLLLLAVDLVNSAVDVVLEPASRAGLGGVSGLEALLHALATFGLGAVAALVFVSESGFTPTPLQLGRGLVSAGLGLGLFLLELSLTLRHSGQRLEVRDVS